MNNRGLLIVIIVLLVGIGGLMIVNHNQRQEQTVGGQIDEVIEEIGDEIDDNT